MGDTNCPYCGAEELTANEYGCGVDDCDIAGNHRTPDCYENELAQLREEIKRLTAITTSQQLTISCLHGDD